MRRAALEPARSDTRAPPAARLLQRKCVCGNHTVAGSACEACARDEAALRHASRDGSPLPAGLRGQMERSFGTDFSSVRLRPNGALECQGLRALTQGDAIDMTPDALGLGAPADRSLLGHELAHVVQQREGRARRTNGNRSGAAMTLEQEAGRAGEAAARGLPVGARSRPSGTGAVAVAQASGPLTDAVDAVRAHGPGVGSTLITEQLVEGIRQAEGEFQRMSPMNRWAESLGLADTVGPGQLGEPAINDVDTHFVAAAAQFASIHGAAPSGWEAKATHPDWSYFYIAAYLARSITEAEKFQASPPAMSNADIGLVPLGIAIYHGAFATMRSMRRRIAGERGVTASEVSYAMVDAELRSGTATPDEMALERYTMLAQGGWNFGFEITAATLSRRFDIAGNKLRVTSLANFRTGAAAGATYTIELRKMEMVCSMGACGEGYDSKGTKTFTVGVESTEEWTGLTPGTYRLRIERSTYSPDVLAGQCRAATIY